MNRTSRATLAASVLLGLLLSSPALAQQSDAPSPGEAAAGAGALFAGVAIWMICVGGLLIFTVATMIFWVITLVDCFQRENSQFPNATENTKTVWIVILLVSWLAGLYWIAAILYYFLVQRKMPRRSLGTEHNAGGEGG